MKNICMVVQSNYPADPRVRRQAERLLKEGFNVDIVCLRKNNEQKVEQSASLTVYRIFYTYSQESFIKYIVLSLTFFFLALIRLTSLSIKKKYDLFQVHNMPDFLVFTGIVFKIKGIPIILDVHDLTLELFKDKWDGKKFSFFIPIIKRIEKMSYNFADKIISVNDTCKEIIEKKGIPIDRITIIFNTADTSIFKFDNSREFKIIKKDARILYHGTVASRFGLHIGIASMAVIKEKIPGSTLSIYGKYDRSYKAELIDLINSLKLENNVFLNETICLEKVYEIIKISDIGLVPYLNNDYMNLSLSTKTFEYAASGLPVVATKLLTLYKTFGENSLIYIKDLNAENLAEEIVQLCLNPEKRKELTLNAFKALNEISGSVMGEKYLKLICDATNS